MIGLPDVGLVDEIAAVHMIRSLGLPIVLALIFKLSKPRL
jgi:predicted ATP-grasp superfamily ATP-dependent carboligase